MANTTSTLLRTALIACLLGTLPTLGFAGVYKWVDEDGTVHYSDTRPGNVKAESMKLRGVGGTKSSSASPQDKARSLDAAREEQLEKQARALQEETEKREQDAKCQVIRDNLNKIATNSRISVIEKGEKRYLDGEEINATRANYQKMLDEHCS